MTRALLLLLLAACDKAHEHHSEEPIDSEAPLDADGDGTLASEDCDDQNADVHPGQPELCNDLDDDCDGVTDNDATDAAQYYSDSDHDGYGQDSEGYSSCQQPPDTSTRAGDCDDENADIHPDAQEICDSVDNNCDSLTDDPSAIDAPIWYADLDNDGFGDPFNAAPACTQPAATVTDNTDCDDTEPVSYPGAPELCDSLDNNCDSFTDEDDQVLGDGELCAAFSCLDIYTARPDAPNDEYWVNPTGVLPYSVWCDMDKGGWTLVYRATNSGGVAENGTLPDDGFLGSTPILPSSTGHNKLADGEIVTLRSGAVANDILVVIAIDGTLLGQAWHPSNCNFSSVYAAPASDTCNKSTTGGAESTSYTQSGHPGSLTRWYVDSALGYIWPATHIGPIAGGTDHGGSIPNPYCTWYDHRTCPKAASFEIWVY